MNVLVVAFVFLIIYCALETGSFLGSQLNKWKLIFRYSFRPRKNTSELLNGWMNNSDQMKKSFHQS